MNKIKKEIRLFKLLEKLKKRDLHNHLNNLNLLNEELEKTDQLLFKINDIIENYLLKNQKKNKSFISNSKDGKFSKLEYKLIKTFEKYYAYQIFPYTGRHHQIRVQLSSAGSPIKGDLKYGAKRSNKDGSINLHARQIAFDHPTKKEKIKIIAPLPKTDIWQLVS